MRPVDQSLLEDGPGATSHTNFEVWESKQGLDPVGHVFRTALELVQTVDEEAEFGMQLLQLRKGL